LLKPPTNLSRTVKTIPTGKMGRRKRDGNHCPPKNNLIQDLEGNEDN
jgi:hypothetical protein